MKLFSSCRFFLGFYYLFAAQCTACSCDFNIFTADSTSGRVIGLTIFICLQTNEMHRKLLFGYRLWLGFYCLFTDQCNVEILFFVYCLSARFCCPFADQCTVEKLFFLAIVSWQATSPTGFLLFSCDSSAGFLLLILQTTAFRPPQDDGGDGMLSPCLGLCYLLSDQRRIMGEMNCCLLVWVSTTCFQTSAG